MLTIIVKQLSMLALRILDKPVDGKAIEHTVWIVTASLRDM